MQATLAELASLVGGKIVGNAEVIIAGAAPLSDVTPGRITLLDGEEQRRRLAGISPTAVVCPPTVDPQGLPAIVVADPRLAFAQILLYFRPARQAPPRGISPLAVVSPTAVLGHDVDIHPFVTIGDGVSIGDHATIHSGAHIMAGSQIGDNVTIFPNAVLYEDTIVGPRSIIHACAVLGAYGFGYDLVQGNHRLSPQLGNVVLGADVEIGAGTTVDRGTFGPTVIGEGTKIDDQVMVAHNCHIGRHNMICSQVGIAGSSSTGDYVVLAGQVGVRDHVHVGARSMVGAKGGIINDVPDGSRMIGIPAAPEKEQKIRLATLTKLPEMRHQLKQLQRTVDALTAQQAAAGAKPEEPATV